MRTLKGATLCFLLVGTSCFNRGTDLTAPATLQISPTQLPADGTSVAQAVATLEFEPKADGTVIFTSSDSNTQITQSASIPGRRYVAQLSSVVPGVITLNVSMARPGQKAALMHAAAVTFTQLTAASSTSSISVNPASQSADGVSTTTVTVNARDASGRAAVGQAITLTSSGTHNFFAQTTGNADLAGQWTTSFASTTGETKALTATMGNAVVHTNMVFFGLPSAVASSLTALPATVSDDGASPSTLLVTIKDAQGNAVPGENVTFSGAGSALMLSATNCMTNASGTCSVTVVSHVAQTATVTATVGAISKTASVTFASGVASLSNSSFSASPNVITADNAQTSTLSVTLRDGTGNAIVGQGVTFSSSGTGDTFSQAAGLTDASGLFTSTLRSTKAQAKVITAANAALVQTANIIFIAGSPNAASSVFTASPSSVTDDGMSVSTLSITVKDIQGNPISGQAVTFSSSGSGYTLSPNVTTTGLAGTASATIKSTVAQTITLTAAFAGLSKTANVTFQAGPISTANSSFTLSPNVLTADNTQTATLTVTLLDGTGNPIGAQAVTFASSGTGDTFSPMSGPTTAAGTLTSTLKSTKAQAKTITASTTGWSQTANVTFVAGVPNLAHSPLTVSPTTLVANGVATAQVTFTAADLYNNIVANAAVTFSASGSGGIMLPKVVMTDTSGVATSAIHATSPGVRALTATISPIASTANVTFTSVSACTSGTTFYPEFPIVAVGSGVNDTAVGDLNVDGILDVVAVNGTDNTVSVALGSGNGLFTTSVPYATGTQPSAVTLVDLDSDGHLDVLVTNATSNTVSVLTGTSSGALNSTSSYAVGSAPAAIAVGDFDADGHPDVVVANQNNNTIDVLLGASSGSGVLTTAQSYTTTAQTNSVAVGDLNGDGRPDVAACGVGSSSVDIFLNAGAGVLGATMPVSSTSLNVALALADFNGDSIADIAVAANGNSRFDTLKGVGNGTFNTAVSHSLPVQPLKISTALLNKDAFVDVVANGNESIMTVLGVGNGTFQAPGNFSGGSSLTGLTLADMDGDGNVDAVGSDINDSSVHITPGLGTGAFAGPVVTGVPGLGALGGLLTDLNGDSNKDMVALDYYGQSMHVYLGTGGAAFSAPKNYSLAQGGPTSVTSGDVNHDAKVDLVVTLGNAIAVFLGAGNGNFTPQTAISFPPTYAIANTGVADFNNDTFDDLAVTVPFQNKVGVMISNGDGSFAAQVYYTVSLAAISADLAVGDFSGDGNIDVAVSSNTKAQVALLLGQNDGTLGAPSFLTLPTTGGFVKAADVNSDSHPDMIVSMSNHATGIVLSHGDGTYAALSSYVGHGQATARADVADMNGDGLMDVITPTDGSFSILYGTGSGLFGRSVAYPCQANTQFIAGADLNGDGLADVVTTTSYSLGVASDYFAVHLASGCSD